MFVCNKKVVNRQPFLFSTVNTYANKRNKQMNLLEAKTLTLDLMTQHGLTYEGWSFNWHNKKRSFGTCSHRKKIIFLSKILTPQLDIDAVTNTILHEIAHALVGSGHGHNTIWQRQAIAIGCDGLRCSDHKVEVDAKYLAECDCGITHKAHRRPKRNHWCKCKGRAFDPTQILQYVQQY